jgi:pilus assembly protein Flp/PilA
MKSLLNRLWSEESGQDLVEYALLITLVSVACVAAMTGLATAIKSAFGTAATNLS